MAIFEIQGPDGAVYEVDAPDQQSALDAFASMSGGDQPKGLGRLFIENIFGDDDPTTQNTGEKIGSWLNRAGEAMTLGLVGDEASAAVESAILGADYDQRRDHYRQQQDILERENPAASFAADLTGGLIPGLITAGAASAPTLIGTMGRGALMGGLEGGLYGFMEGEGGAKQRAENAAGMAAFGGAFGGAAPAMIAGAEKAGRAFADPALGALDIGNQSRAGRAMMQTVNKSGKTVDDLAREVAEAAGDGQPGYRLMDALGQAGQRRASGVARSGGPGADEIAGFLQQRQVDQGDRIGEMVRDAFGFRGATRPAARTDVVPQGFQFGDDVAQTLRRPAVSAQRLGVDLTAARGNAANTAYDAARKSAGPVDVRAAVSAIDDRIGGMKGSGIAGDSIDARLSRYRGRLIADPAPAGELSRELSDFDRVLGVKQAVQDDIGAAVRAGRNNEARELTKIVRELDDALEAASPDYRAANDAFREASRVIDSVDTGSGMAARGRAADTVPQFNAMTTDQQQAARIGYGDRILDEIERNKAAAPNAARAFGSTKRQQEAAALALNPEQLSRQVQRENDMYGTFQRALGGSRTADNLSDIADLSPMADAGRAVRDAASGNVPGVIGNLASAAKPYLSGQNEATRAAIAKILMSDNPVKALETARKSQNTSEATRRVIESMLRAAVRGQVGAY